jgi:predicted membrane channel-forming protein YqfA (hemolysin III family)
MNFHSINIEALNKEMYYKPSWYLDKNIFIYLLGVSDFTTEDIFTIARLYIKYKPIKNQYELQIFFQYLLKKINCTNISDVYNITRNNYSYQNKFIKIEHIAGS